MPKFTVIDIPANNVNEVESDLEGAVPKYWLEIPDLGRCIVKADFSGAWIEKIAVALAEEIDLPVASCELVERADGLKMVASPDFIKDGAVERSGEDILVAELGEKYLYSLDAIFSVVDRVNILLPSEFTPTGPIATAGDLLTGYLIYDSWIGNIDRHSKNWGLQQFLDGRKELLPTYDHGLSLAAFLMEDELPSDIKNFSKRCPSAVKAEVGSMDMNALVDRLLELKPEADG